MKEHAEDMSISFEPDECSWMEEFPLFQLKIVLSNNLNVKMAECEKRELSSISTTLSRTFDLEGCLVYLKILCYLQEATMDGKQKEINCKIGSKVIRSDHLKRHMKNM